jgi:hypothetical protein
MRRIGMLIHKTMDNFQREEVTKDTLTLFKEATDYYRTPRAQHTFIAITAIIDDRR